LEILGAHENKILKLIRNKMGGHGVGCCGSW